ncbi:MAG: CotH kinase family protein [Clostridiales bacterium]|nr:CotH kinase family protein [Clostridiales bacterium]
MNDEKAGRVRGSGIRELTSSPSRVEAIPNLGYRFVCWSDGSTEETRMDYLKDHDKNVVYTAIFDYAQLEMPFITINTETGKDVKSKTDYIQAELSILGTDEKFELSENVQIRGRGNNTWGYEKKSYKIKFPKKVNLFGLGKAPDKVWVLLANVCDQSLQRNHVALDLAKSFDGVAFSPASISVDVYLNGEYRGVYLLAEEIRDSKARVNIDTKGFETEVDIGYLVELSSYSDKDKIVLNGRQYMIHSDLSSSSSVKKKQMQYISDYMAECYEAIKRGDRKEIEKLMDIDSMVDTYITEEIVKNLDTGWDSYYLYKEKGGKLFLGPLWDFDLSLGNANEGEETYYGIFTAVRKGSGGGNPWYYHPMSHEWFRKLVVERWDEVKKSIIDKIPQSILDEGKSKYKAYARNFVRWPIFGTVQNRETEAITKLKNYREHYEYLAEWVKNRIDWLDEFYHQDGFLTMDLENNTARASVNFKDDKTKKLYESLENLTYKVGVDRSSGTEEGFPGEGVENAFDDEYNTKYCWQCYGESEITFRMKEAVSPTHYALMTANDTSGYPQRNPQKWKIYGSSDNKNWDLLAEVKDGKSVLNSADFTWHVFKLDKTGSYRYYKMLIENDDIVQFSEISLMK